LEKRNKVAFTVPRVALVDQTFKRFVQNGIDPADIGVMQGDHSWNRPSAPIQICSVPTLASRGFPDVSFSIVDEAHLRYAIIDKWMTEQPDKIFVALTATPWAKGMGDFWDDLIIPTSIGELIERGDLAKFKVLNGPRPDLSGISVVNTPNGRDYNEDQLSARYSAKQIVADVVSTWLKKGDNQPTLCFAVDRGHAQALQDQFLSAGVPSAYIDANTPRDERESIFSAYAQGDVKIIVSIGTLTVGVDVDCRCLIMARRTMSEMLFVQIIGRALRTAEGKDFAIILDHTDNHHRLGRVTDIHHDTLRTSKNEVERKDADEKEQRDRPKPFECPQCGWLVPYQARECECGWVARRPNTVETADGELREFAGGAKVKTGKREPVISSLRAQGQQAIYSQLLAMQGTKKNGWVLYKFKSIFDVLPPRYLLRNQIEPTGALRSFIRSQNIAYTKAREKAGDGGYSHAAE
jgi:superfamily II DNA or RNA helicase